MTRLQPENLPERQRHLFKALKTRGWLGEFYLAGGTGLALQIGHRESVDFDFFTQNDISSDELTTLLGNAGKFKRTYEERNTLYGELNGVRVSFISYAYPLIEDPVRENYISVAGLKDISAMKLSAILARGARKDFVDLYYLLQAYSLTEIFQFYETKYKAEEYQYTLLRSLQYFEDAEQDPMPLLRKPVSWGHIKKFITALVRQFDII